MDDITITFAIVAAVVVLFVWGRVPVEVVAVGAALALWATGVLDLQQALAGFGDPTVIFIASLFVVSEALDATGVTSWVGQRLIAWAGDGRARLLVLMTPPGAERFFYPAGSPSPEAAPPDGAAIAAGLRAVGISVVPAG